MARRGEYLDAKVYIGGLPEDATSQEIEDIFHRYGRIRKVWVARRPPGFGFVEYEDSRDAEDAVRALDGSRICGVRARVELSHGRSRRGGGGGGGGFSGRGYGGDRGGGYGGGRRDDRGYDRDRYDDRSRDRRRSKSPRRTRSPGGRDSPRYEEQRDRSPRRSPVQNGNGDEEGRSPRRSFSRSRSRSVTPK